MNKLLEVGRSVLSSGAARNLGPLRSVLKKALVTAASGISPGAKVSVGSGRTLLVPWDFVGAARWHEYEPRSLEFFAGLIDREPETVFFDIGCAMGIYSLLALSVSEQTRVYSLDSDLMALTICKHMCRRTARNRHAIIWGFCSDYDSAHSNSLRADLSAAAKRSEERLKQAGLNPRLGANRYVCMDGNQSEDIPCWEMDSLLGPMARSGQPMILKIDIEGAEIAMLRGAAGLAECANVQMLLSVHAHILPSWKSSAEEVRHILSARGYEISILEVDREQHWWVRKAR
jgi:FkbM family methyltransferase